VPGKTKEPEQEILEVVKATEDLKPILIYFHKPVDPFAEQERKKDREAKDCKNLHEQLWKQWVITELAKEFVCVRVNARKADPKMLRKHRVARAPVLKILDYQFKQIHFCASPKVKYKSFAMTMDRARTKVEKAVKKLAKSKKDSPLVQKAVARVKSLDQRALFDKGLSQIQRRNWSGAEKAFNEGIGLGGDSDWKKKCEAGLKEIEAGKLFMQAQQFEKTRRYVQCKETLDKILGEYKEAVYFVDLAKDLLSKIARKLKDKKKKK